MGHNESEQDFFILLWGVALNDIVEKRIGKSNRLEKFEFVERVVPVCVCYRTCATPSCSILVRKHTERFKRTVAIAIRLFISGGRRGGEARIATHPVLFDPSNRSEIELQYCSWCCSIAGTIRIG